MNDPHCAVRYDQTYQRYYRMKYNYNTANWEFVEWLNELRRDSHSHPNHAGALQPQRRVTTGHVVYGNYEPSNPNPAPDALNYNQLDQSYFVRDSTFFQEGKLFAILFTEPAGANAVAALSRVNAVTDYNSAISRITYGELVHSQVRRFIVVDRKREFCYAIPIFTYSDQGTKKRGVVPDEHAIAYSYGYRAQLLQGEQQLTKNPICIIMAENVPPLKPASRIYFGIQHPIQYNVKVKDLGYVYPDHMATLKGYWAMEHGNATRQSSDVTLDADRDADPEEDDEEHLAAGLHNASLTDQ